MAELSDLEKKYLKDVADILPLLTDGQVNTLCEMFAQESTNRYLARGGNDV